jgi:Flp pilus assembly protein TadD
MLSPNRPEARYGGPVKGSSGKLDAQTNLYVAAEKWYLAAASCLVKADPGNPDTWIKLAHIVRRAENVEQAEKVLFKARAWHPKNALIAFNLACYASAMGRTEEAKIRLLLAIKLDKNIRRLALVDKDLQALSAWTGPDT